MHIPDLINGCFESSGAVALALNVRAILRDKQVRGFRLAPTLFFMSWGWWNLFYYPHLGQWFSFSGGACLVAVNTLYTGLVVWYSVRNRRNA